MMRELTKAVGAAALASVLLSGCAAKVGANAEPVPAVTPTTARFAWTPASSAAKVGVGMGIVSPAYDVQNLSEICQRCGLSGEKLAEEIRNALGTDLEKGLIAKGYAITGTFDDLGNMTYGQKDKSALVLVPKITLYADEVYDKPVQVNWNSKALTGEPDGPLMVEEAGAGIGGQLLKVATGIDLEVAQKFRHTGNYKIGGKISLSLHEPVTGEKMWIKDIQLQELTRPFTFYYWMGTAPDAAGELPVHILPEYDQRANALKEALVAAYAQAYTEFDRFFDPREISAVAKDAAEVRKKKRYE